MSLSILAIESFRENSQRTDPGGRSQARSAVRRRPEDGRASAAQGPALGREPRRPPTDNALAEDDHRALQDRARLPPRSVVPARRHRARHPRVGLVVQQPPPAQADRPCPTGPSSRRSTYRELPHSSKAGDTQINRSPMIPGGSLVWDVRIRHVRFFAFQPLVRDGIRGR